MNNRRLKKGRYQTLYRMFVENGDNKQMARRMAKNLILFTDEDLRRESGKPPKYINQVVEGAFRRKGELPEPSKNGLLPGAPLV